ncbi:TPA: hypothetical protein ENX78_09265 [Candidatus Poribacteria bacterium]|nr:hypothetical protein [Candidatus Poribacteria bacterium]
MTLEQQKDRETVLELARKVVELAKSDEYEARRKRWRDVNGLRKPDRFPVYCRPVGAWAELLPANMLTCKDPFCRNIEYNLRMRLIKHEIGDDDPLEPYWTVGVAFDQHTPHTWGVPINYVSPNTPGGAYRYDPPLKTEADFDKLKLPEYTYNEEKTKKSLAQMQEFFGDVMEVRLSCGIPLHPGLANYASSLRGLDQLMYDMSDRPDLVHRLMKHLQEGILKAMKEYEDSGMLTLNNTGAMYCSDPPRNDAKIGNIKLKDLWGQTESQEFQEVSPKMWEEFLLSYQIPILSKFWLVSYGCCENLTRKINGVLKIPNLRIFVSSAWTDLAKVAEAVGDRYTIMWRQKATDVVFGDLDSIRKHLDEGMKIVKGCYVQIVLRELQTLNGNNQRLKEWADIAKEISAKYA